jgi:hypothetical protein
MVFANLFSSTFLFNLAIIILIGCVLAYVSYKMIEQDHKLNSMIGLVTTMAEEMHFFRNKLNIMQNNNVVGNSTNKLVEIFGGNNELIEVSDNEELEEEEDLEDEDRRIRGCHVAGYRADGGPFFASSRCRFMMRKNSAAYSGSLNMTTTRHLASGGKS